MTQTGVYPYAYAEVPAAPVLALGAAARRARIARRRAGRRADSLHAGSRDAARQENAAHWIDRDPELKCYLPGIPRATYMPYPFQIVQSTNEDPDDLHVLECGPHDPPGQGREVRPTTRGWATRSDAGKATRSSST